MSKRKIFSTLPILYRDGYKGTLHKPWGLPLPAWFYHWVDDYGLYSNDFMTVHKCQVDFYVGFAWNYANYCPDWDFIRKPSMVHDGLLQWLQHLVDTDKIVEGSDEYKEFKHDIDEIFMLMCKMNLPDWCRYTPKVLFVFVNYLSRLAPGSQAEDHRVRVAP